MNSNNFKQVLAPSFSSLGSLKKRRVKNESLASMSHRQQNDAKETCVCVCVCVFSCWCTNKRTNDKERALSSSYLTNHPSRAGCGVRCGATSRRVH